MGTRTTFKYFACLLAALAFVSFSFYRVYKGQETLLERIDSDYADGRAINLSKETNAATLGDFLVNNNYIKESSEAKFVANHILSVLRAGKDISTINALNSRRFAIKQDSVTLAAVAGYSHLIDRFESQREKLGMCSDVEMAYVNSTDTLPTFEGAALKMRIKIKDSESNALVSPPVVLRITEHWNELHSAGDGRTSCESRDSVYAYICVAGGKTKLSLPKFAADGSRRYFSILPVKDGYYYGTAKGTYKNKWWKSMKFFQRETSIPPFEPTVYRAIKDDCTITVRTPDDYRRILSTTIMTFWAIWILLFAVLAVMDAKSKHRSNLGILAIGATLTGLGLSTLFAIPNPLSAQLLGFEQLIKGIIPGAIALAVCAAIDWNKFFSRTRDKWLTNTSLHGIFFAILALLLTVITIIFGTGPEGSGAKINLNLGLSVQPAPVINILLALYFAIFLTNKEPLIQGFAAKSMSREDIKRRSKLVSVVLVFTLIIIGLQIFALGDMGPALCSLFVAICIYSLVRQDFTRMIVGVGSFILLSWAVKMTSLNVYPLVTVVVWITGWVIYGYFIKKRLFESAILMVLIIAGLMYGGDILSSFGADSAGERLAGRVEMSLKPFDNEVSGGDQVAHSAFAISNGGLWGRTGEFNCARTIPAAHTDMILSSVAETHGLLGVMVVLILFGILVYYSIAVGLKNGRGFAYNLSVLMGLGIGVQAMVIMLGAIGVIPLTGVNLPFLSQGSSALVIQLAGLGIIISVSRQSPLTEINTRKYAAASSVLMGVFCLLSIVIFIKCANWGFVNRDEYLVKPAYIRDIHGNRIVEYNPRIANTMKMMRTGNIIDRNGLILATSDGELIAQDSILVRYEKLGIDRSSILLQIKGHKRIYPLYRHLFFSIGDANRKIMWGGAGLSPAGLLAEERWYSRLRGYNTMPEKRLIYSTKHHSDFLPDETVYQSDKCVVYDYSALVPLMKSSTALEKWNAAQEERDIQLTVDARLQVLLDVRTEQYVKEQRRKNNKITDRTRISVAVVDGATGEVLCTSIYPLADPDLLAAKAKAKDYIYRDDLHPGFKAYSDRDLAATYATAPGSTAKTITGGAGLRKFGIAYAGPQYAERVYADELVDVSLGEPIGNVDLNTAIVGSSNVFFIKSAARRNLYQELSYLYWSVGAHIGYQSYYLYPNETISLEHKYKKYIDTLGHYAVSKFHDYEEAGIRHRLIDAEYQETWGQGKLSCTPLALTRYLGAVGNNGILMSPKYTTFEPTIILDTLMSKDEANALFSCMKNQATDRFTEFGVEIGGKTGTPVRIDRQSLSGLCNDAWYAFVVRGKNGHPYSVVVRFERVHANSSLAIDFTKQILLPVLSECDYL